MTTPQHPHPHHPLITQSYYDELLASNAELHDLGNVADDPAERERCVSETLEELLLLPGSSGSGSGGGHGGDASGSSGGDGGGGVDHLILPHPASPAGAAERARRARFEAALAGLDGLVRRDGTVRTPDADGEAEAAALRHLRLVQDECGGGGGGGGTGIAASSTGGEAAAAEVDGRRAYRSLVAFRTASGIYTLMSLLGAVALPSDAAAAAAASSSAAASGSDDNDNGSGERILRQTCRTLASILGPPTAALVRSVQRCGGTAGNGNNIQDGAGTNDNDDDNDDHIDADADADAPPPSDGGAASQTLAAALAPPPVLLGRIRSAKSGLRDDFVAFERVVGLIERYTARAPAAAGTSAGSSFGTLTDLARLSAAACGGCEKNKVAFARAGGGTTRKEKGEKKGGIAAVVAVLGTLVVAHHHHHHQQRHRRADTGGGAETKVAEATDADATGPALAAYCRLLAVLCRFDDFRSPSAGGRGGGGALPTPDVAVSSAHDHVLEFHRRGVVPVLHEVTALALSDDETEGDGSDVNGGGGSGTDLASAALAATRTLAVNDEIVQALVAAGVLRSARLALAAGVADADDADDDKPKSKAKAKAKAKAKQRRALTSASLGLIRNLCGNDEIKTNLCLGTADGNAETSTVLPSIVRAMRLYRADAAVQEHGCATLAAMALRKPANAQRIVEEGGPMEVLTAMRRHPSIVPVQRQGALAVRNISSRLIKIAEAEQNDGNGGASGGGNVATSPKSSAADTTTTAVEVRETFLDLGAESVLRDIAGRHQGSVDEAYAALRDLGCKVSMVRYDTDEDGQAKSGSGTRGVTMFGEAKTKFNPVFEESNELGAAVDRL